MSRSNTVVCNVCQCSFDSSSCVHMPGRGTTDRPYKPEVIVSTAAGNMVESGPSGVGAFLDPIYLDPPACLLYEPVDQTIGFNAAQILFFTESRYDTDSMHDPMNDSSRITIKTPGIYLVTLNVRWSKTNDSTFTGDLAAFIRKNGSDFVALDSYPVPGGDSFAKHSISFQGALEAGEYLEAMVQQDVEDTEDVAQVLRITSHRMSPNFAASFLRTTDGMSILGFDS